jgi:hypothetical protein
MEKFKNDMSGHVYAYLIEESLKSGVDSSVEDTSTFFISRIKCEDS